MPVISQNIPIIVVALTLGALSGFIGYPIAGDSLGFWFSGIGMMAAVLPPLADDEGADGARLAIGAMVGMSLSWLVAPLFLSATFSRCLGAIAVLIAFSAVLVAAVRLLRRAIGVLAPSVVIMIALLWLSWPIWLSPTLSGHGGAVAVAWLTPAHPLFAINRLFIDQGAWIQQPIMYQITALGQDVPVALPGGIAVCVLAHLIIALALGSISAWLGRERRPMASLHA